jgi:nitrite reductase/ring-hydroxylating ferredoxin subunit
LIAKRRPGWSLPQEFHNDDDVYRADLDRIWRRGWLFAGHACEISRAGDYFLVQLEVDSIIVIRGDDGVIHALYNVCRHRGSIVCTEPCGHVVKLVCPYHQWTYNLDGRLAAWRGMQPGLRKEDFGLHAVHVREVEGLLFISLAKQPPPFDAAQECLAPLLRSQGFRRAKVAKAVDYLVKANWKVVWENNRECYHCNINHPQYIKANFDHYNADDTTPRIRQQIGDVVGRSDRKWAGAGLAPAHKQTGMTRFPDAGRGIWFSANRTPLVDGWMSESMDGRQVAPFDDQGRPAVYLPGPTASSLPLVRRAVARAPAARPFLAALNLTEPDLIAEVLQIVLPRYDGLDLAKLDPARHDADLECVVRALDEAAAGRREELLGQVRQTAFLIGENAAGGEPRLLPPPDRIINGRRHWRMSTIARAKRTHNGDGKSV